jgi:hypothetical protein
LKWKLAHPFHRFYWLLICSGCRTYLSLARNFPEHWPHFRRGLPEWEKGLIHAICSRKFGANWKPEEGVIRVGSTQPRLKDHVAPFTEKVKSMEEIRFFIKANPGFERGDELAVIGNLNFGFFFAAIRKLLRKLL